MQSGERVLTGSDARRLTRREAIKVSTRSVLAGATAASTVLAGSGCAVPTEPPRVKVGILHSQTGTMAISEISLRDAEIMAIEQINAAGGILGRQIIPVVEDTKSQFDYQFPKKARKLLFEERVAVVFGCWTSASRKAVIPIFEESDRLLFYPLQYEGNEASANVIYTGSLPNQQILPAIDWALSEAGGRKSRIFLIGSDYIFPRTANFIIKKYLATKGLEPVGETYRPLGHAEFGSDIDLIERSEADLILSTINGDSNIAFYNALYERKISAERTPVLATSVGEDELRSLDPRTVIGQLAAWSYFQSVNTPENHAFVGRFQADHSRERVLDDPMEAAYTAVMLWKTAVEAAGSFDTLAVRTALRSGITYAAPGGLVKVDPDTQHTYKRFRLGRVREDRQFDIIHESPDWIAPEPFPQFAFPGWSVKWTSYGLRKGEPVVF